MLPSHVYLLLSRRHQFGRCLAASVESSNRSSVHCSVVDALRAAESCAAPAALQVSMDHSANGNGEVEGAGSTLAVLKDSTADGSWEGLADFLFGRDWASIRIPGVTDVGEGVAPTTPAVPVAAQTAVTNGGSGAAAGGGGGKNAAIMARQQAQRAAAQQAAQSEADQDDKNLESPSGAAGWDAPYPDDVPPFPIRSKMSASHSLNYFRNLRSEEEACAAGDSTVLGSGHHHAPGGAFAGKNTKGRNKAATKAAREQAAKEAAARAEARADAESARVFDNWGEVGGPGKTAPSDSGWGALAMMGGVDCSSGGGADHMEIDRTPPKIAPSRTATPKSGDGEDIDKDSSGSKARKRIRFDEDNKKDSVETGKDGGGEPPKKMAKSDLATFEALAKGTDGDKGRMRRPAYVPSFLPPFPPALTYRVSAVLPSAFLYAASSPATEPGAAAASTYEEEEDIEGSRPGTVRGSLVRLGRAVGSAHWGAVASICPSEGIGRTGDGAPTAIVPAGRYGATSGRDGAAGAAVVAPPGRASGNRISKILEGSMDAYQ